MKNIFLILFFYSAIILPQQLNITKHLSGITVYSVAGKGDDIWAATNGNGLFNYSLKSNRWKNYSTSNGELQIDFFYCIDLSDKYVFAGSTDGLFILDRKRNKWSKRKFGKGGQLSNWIRSIKYDPADDVAWIGRFKYLSRFDMERRRFDDFDLTAKNDDKTNTIKSIQIDGDSLVWFGTENGLHKYDKSRSLEEDGTVKFYDNSRNNFQGDGDAVSISSIVIEQNFVWIGLDEFITEANPNYNLGGAYKYDRRNEWIRFDTRMGLKGNGIFDMKLIGNFIWVSCYQFSPVSKEQFGRGLALIDRLTEKVIQITDPGLPDTIYSIYFDGRSVWLGAYDGLYQIDISNNFVADFSKIKE